MATLHFLRAAPKCSSVTWHGPVMGCWHPCPLLPREQGLLRKVPVILTVCQSMLPLFPFSARRSCAHIAQKCSERSVAFHSCLPPKFEPSHGKVPLLPKFSRKVVPGETPLQHAIFLKEGSGRLGKKGPKKANKAISF